MYQLFVYVPVASKEKVKQAIFNAGAGKYQHYACCCWETSGTGQFKPLATANPAEGDINVLHRLQEYRIEFICVDKNILENAINAMKAAHPYEEVAYGVIELKNS